MTFNRLKPLLQLKYFIKAFFYIFIVLFVCCNSLNANNLNSIANIKSFEAEFSQIVYKDNLQDDIKIKYSGKIYIDGSKVLWHYKKPFVKYLYIKKNKITTIEPLLEQAVITKLQKQFDMLQILQKAKQISANNNARVFATTLNNIEYKITTKNNIIYKIEYKDEVQNKVTIKFSKQKQNQTIKASIFVIKIPDSYDVLIR